MVLPVVGTARGRGTNGRGPDGGAGAPGNSLLLRAGDRVRRRYVADVDPVREAVAGGAVGVHREGLLVPGAAPRLGVPVAALHGGVRVEAGGVDDQVLFLESFRKDI